MVDETPATPGIAGHLKQALIGAHDHLADRIDERKKAHVANVLEQFETDIAPHLAPLVDQALANPGMPDELRALVAEVGTPQHFSSSLLIGVAVGAIIGPVLGSAVEPYVQAISNNAWAANPSRPLTPDLLAAAVLKGVESQGTAATEAQKSGIAAGAFDVMVKAAGNAIGFEQALELSRRNLLTGVTLDDVLHYSNVNPAFYAAAKNLITNPATIGEVLNARIRTHLTDGQAQELYAEAGGIPAQYQWRLDSTGRPPGPMQVGELFNRKIIGDDVASQMLAQSDLALQFQSTVKELWKYYPPPRSLVPMLRANAIDEAKFRLWMSYYGAPPDVVDAFIKEAGSSSTSTAKTLTQAQVTASYELKLITRPAALAKLESVRFSADDANAILDLADEKRQQAMDNAVVRMIGQRYVTRKIGKPEATTQLNAIPIPTAAIADLFHLWDIELQITTYHPSPAGVVGALRRGILNPKECYTRLHALGVADTDIAIVVGDGYPPTAPQDAQAAADAVLHQLAAIPGVAGSGGTGGKSLTASQVSKLYSAGTIPRAEAVADLTRLGYTATQADQLLSLAEPPPGG